MGHFSYTCHLSGLPITGGTPCVMLPILPRQNTYDNELTSLRRYGKGSLVSKNKLKLDKYPNRIFLLKQESI